MAPEPTRTVFIGALLELSGRAPHSRKNEFCVGSELMPDLGLKGGAQGVLLKDKFWAQIWALGDSKVGQKMGIKNETGKLGL